MASISDTTSISTRRKPKVTYKSPCEGEPYSLRPFQLSPIAPSKSVNDSTKSDSINHATHQTALHAPFTTMCPKSPLTLPLPLYHPLGCLALSSPPLDPTSFGLPMLTNPEEALRRSSGRARRPVAKLRDAEEASDLLTTSGAITMVATREIQEKPSPRKRRLAGAKRRRRDADDGDAAYPTKRARPLRAGAELHVDDGSVLDQSMQASEYAAVPEREHTPDATDNQHPERRSTRSWALTKRRGSDASECTSTSLGVAGLPRDSESVNVEKVHVDEHRVHHDAITADGDNEEKEEGELSEDGPPIA
ncbi:hypothetical protein AX17_005840 [Amanita inopinata Kibby_2008]|nr:hypothetical protein AX17_005840 [Amanita inopinata Kibby_2008]